MAFDRDPDPTAQLAPGHVRVTCEDGEGDPEVAVITDDFILVTAGRRFLASILHYPSTGTTVLTVKTTAPTPGGGD